MYKKILFFLFPYIFCSCDNYKTLSSGEIALQTPWKRNNGIETFLHTKNECKKTNLIADIYYNEDVQYQNIFLHIILKDKKGNIVFEKKDIMLILFDATTGYPLGRKIFRKQHLPFIIAENLEITPGEYKVEISQQTRSENLYGINKIIIKLIS